MDVRGPRTIAPWGFRNSGLQQVRGCRMAVSDAPSSPLGRPGFAARPGSSTRPDLQLRIDAAHGFGGAEVVGATEIVGLDADGSGSDADGPSWQELQAIAGYDAQAAGQQLRLQALELAAILREKQRTLEDREAVLNARAAKLENDLRVQRLRDAWGADSGSGESETACGLETSLPRSIIDAGLDLSGSSAELHDARSSSGIHAPVSVDGFGVQVSAEIEHLLVEDFDRAARAAALELDFQAEWEALEKDRQELQQRELSVIRRQRDVERLHDESTDLHREALELRLATEQLWEELVDHVPRVDLTRTLTELRARLADHYRMASESLTHRREELQSIRAELQSQEQRIRQQYREIQLWADRRYEELEARTAELVYRERELDQREAALQHQSLHWQQQTDDYRREIERLSWQLRDQRNWLDS